MELLLKYPNGQRYQLELEIIFEIFPLEPLKLKYRQNSKILYESLHEVDEI